jgi:excisionase family DNA binding protein
MSKRTEITIETHRRLIVRSLGVSISAWCPGCVANVRMITPEQAAALMNVSSRTIYQLIESGGVHFIEQRGQMLICAESLPAYDS